MARASQCGAVKSSAFVRSTFGSSPQPVFSSEPRQEVLDRLRKRIRQIENRTPQFKVDACEVSHNRLAAGSPSGLLVEDGGILPRDARTPMSSSSPLPSQQSISSPKRPTSAWTLGDSSLDHMLGLTGLETDAVHELKGRIAPNENGQAMPNWAGCWSATRQFLLTLIIRRFLTNGIEPEPSAPGILWCWPRTMAQEFGSLYAPGLSSIGVEPHALTIVEPAQSQDVLWAMEEGLKSQALSCVVGVLDDVDLTPARRLALAAQKYAVPVLVLTNPRTPPMAATATRWRVAPMPSAQHPIKKGVPGRLRLRLSLERRRTHNARSFASNVEVEWCPSEKSFRLINHAQQTLPDKHWTSSRTKGLAL